MEDYNESFKNLTNQKFTAEYNCVDWEDFIEFFQISSSGHGTYMFSVDSKEKADNMVKMIKDSY